jgi:hypothetical protein
MTVVNDYEKQNLKPIRHFWWTNDLSCFTDQVIMCEKRMANNIQQASAAVAPHRFVFTRMH